MLLLKTKSVGWRCLALVVLLVVASSPAQARLITDGLGRQLEVPERIERLICSGPGCLRLITYLQAEELVVAVDDMETRRSRFEARPYSLAQPQLKKLPVFGQFRGQDNAERIISLEPAPQVIFKTFANIMGTEPEQLQVRTALPVVALNYGNLAGNRSQFYQTLRLLGRLLDRQERAEELVAFFETTIADIQARSGQPHPGPTVYLGGVAFKGPHGLRSTEPAYPPFLFTRAHNVAALGGAATSLKQTEVGREQLVAWDPEYIFVDLATLQMGGKGGGLYQLQHEAAYQALQAAKQGRVYGVLPYNWYSINYGSILANGYYIGSLIHPQAFADVDVRAKADEIYTFLVGSPVLDQLAESFQGLVFQPLIAPGAGQ